MRQLLAESLVLAALGGILGILVAQSLLKVVIATGPASLVRSQTISTGFAALLFTAAVVLFAAALSGVAPAWRGVLSAEIGNSLRAAGRTLQRARIALGPRWCWRR